MSYEPSFSKRPGGTAGARPRFFSLLGLGSDTGDSGPPALKVIIDEESHPNASRTGDDSAVSLMRALDSAGDQGVSSDSSFPPKPASPTKKQQAVSPVAQKFGRRAAVESKPKGEFHFHYFLMLNNDCRGSNSHLAALSPSKSNQLKESPASVTATHHGQTTPRKNPSPMLKNSSQKPSSPHHPNPCQSPAQQELPQPQQLASNENQAPVSSSVVSPSAATMKATNVKFGFSKFGFSFSKPKATSPKPVKSAMPAALGSPIAVSTATPRLPELEPVQETVVGPAGTSALNAMPLQTPCIATDVPITADAVVADAAGAPVAPSDVKPSHIVGLSSRAQQLMAELAAEDDCFGGLDFTEPAKKEKRVLIEKGNLVRKNIKSGQKSAAPQQHASGFKSDAVQAAAARPNPNKPLAPQAPIAAAAVAPTVAAPAAAPVDGKQVEHLKRTIDGLRAQLDAARVCEKKVVTLENQLAEQNGLLEGMRKEIRQ